MNERKRPFGLSAIIILQMINILAIVGIFYLQIDPTLSDFGKQLANLNLVSTFFQTSSMLLLAVALPAVWYFKRWGWVLLMLQLGVSLSIGIWQFFVELPNFIMMGLNVATVFYLNQREVQQLFEKQEAVAEQTEAWI